MKKKINNSVEIKNRKASFEYEFLETEVCGLVLLGSEVKSIREGKCSIGEAYCYIQKKELWITGMHIAEYKEAGQFGHDPYRTRKLLLTKKQIIHFEKELKIQGKTIVPIKLFSNDKGVLKLNIALAKGKREFDKRNSIKDKDIKRDNARELNNN